MHGEGEFTPVGFDPVARKGVWSEGKLEHWLE
jgi:hypothetical protein